MTDLICVDAAAREDLMLQDQMARGVLARRGMAERLLILLGTGEPEERRLETTGHSPDREKGALTSVSPSVEGSMRESVRSLTNRMTDEGVFAVGMMATDGGLVTRTEGVLTVSPRLEQRLWTGPGVVPVLGCLVQDHALGLHDVHPLTVACALADRLDDDARVVLLTRRRTAGLTAALQQNDAVSRHELMAEGAFLEGVPMPSGDRVWFATSIAEIGSGRLAKVR